MSMFTTQVQEQRAKRHGIVVRRIELPVSPTVRQTVERFRRALTPKTKLLVASHIADGWGYVLPIRELSDLAHGHGAQLLVDGALSFGHVPVSMKALGCDYYATSLHKWLNAPLGTGALFVRRERLEALWPLYGNGWQANDIFDRDPGEAIDVYERIGPERKAARLRNLTAGDRWTEARSRCPGHYRG